VGDDFGSGLSEYVIRSGVLDVPICIENSPYRLPLEPVSEELDEIGCPLGKAAVDEQEALGLGENNNVATGSRNHG
jgi:hypothetical protein